MDEIRCDQFRNERWHNICQEDDSFRNIGANEVKRCREDDDIEDIIDEACRDVRYL